MPAHRPGDTILDRYMPHATSEEREIARANLRRFARLLLRVKERRDRENPQGPIRAIADPALESESLPTSV